MKIKATQLDLPTRNTVAEALIRWSKSNEDIFPKRARKYLNMAQVIKHGELILCEYQYNEQEKGGNHED